ncbi:MAG TPA: zonular occludens toxin domain-containing protein [Acidimicrobiales bacterium]|nr:zonular occludens toxin domain-containing protein [Acidimicrobiales bacterium]
MINLLLGAPGGGKSYEATVYHILPALQKGRKVVTNLPLSLDAFAAIDPAFPALIEIRTASKGARKKDGSASRVFSVVEDYADEWRHADGFGPLFVIDECHFALPKGKTDRAVEEWYSMHRHYNVDVLLITQSYGKISAAVRDLVQMVYRVRKNVALGSTGSYTRKVQDGVRGEVVNTSIRKYEKRYFGLYRSHTQGKAVDEFNAADVKPIWRHWSFQLAAVCALVVGYQVAAGNFRAPWKVEPKEAKAKPSSSPQAAAPFAVAPAVASAPSAAPVAAPAASAQADAEAKGKVHPFNGRGLHLVGFIESPTKGRRWSFALSQNGQLLGTISEAELQQAGYQWAGHSQCSGVLRWEKVELSVICDAPSVGVAFAKST